MAADFKTAQPREYYRRFLKEDVRPDGRSLEEIRPTILNVGSISTADGSALVKLGHTSVICGIKAAIAKPAAEKPKQGFIVPNVDLPPLCSSRFKPGPPSDQAQAVSQLVADIIKNAGIIDLEDLCIAEDKLCWVLYCDLMCLDYDGNIVDACMIVLMAALKNGEFFWFVCVCVRVCVCYTNICEQQNMCIRDRILIADPTVEEEDLATGVVTIALNENNNLCCLHKPGGSPLTENQLQDCINRAKVRTVEVRKLITTTADSVER
ncbi:exosome complex component RRP43-like [Anneissia japonica]|uniref:exosome complex component RRP43-like n=1 Tax=Anneissia japonica TaxID=1529436 RepID=UPI001425523C|nr:exosome complex component RRP43-like [Anneissia japonica]